MCLCRAIRAKCDAIGKTGRDEMKSRKRGWGERDSATVAAGDVLGNILDFETFYCVYSYFLWRVYIFSMMAAAVFFGALIASSLFDVYIDDDDDDDECTMYTFYSGDAFVSEWYTGERDKMGNVYRFVRCFNVYCGLAFKNLLTSKAASFSNSRFACCTGNYRGAYRRWRWRIFSRRVALVGWLWGV